MPPVRRVIALLVPVAAALVLATPALAHPLGNFTVNEYAGVRVRTTGILVDAVLDRAEIPTFEVRRRLDTDADGVVSPDEADRARQPECDRFGSDMELTVGGVPAPLSLAAAGLSFPPGSGGLATSRLVCQFTAPLTLGRGPAAISFSLSRSPRQPGWREIVVEGDGATVDADGIARESVSHRLTAYPADRLATPPAIDAVEFVARAGGPTLAPPVAPDARPLLGTSPATAEVASAVTADPPTQPEPVAVRGDPLPDVFRADLSPVVATLAVLTAALLGGGHALTPGHGKTVIAAWLVGSRATPVQAAQIGLTVAIAHTLGVVALAVLAVAGEQVLPPGTVALGGPVIAGAIVVAIGVRMVIVELERRHRRSRPGAGPSGQPHAHDHGVPPAHVSRRGLFGLGLAGGLVPSASALVILLGAFAAGRAAFGLVLVVAFGLGMGVVMTLLGVLIVRGRDRLVALQPVGAANPLLASMPLVAACLVVGMGAWLTGQALAPILAG